MKSEIIKQIEKFEKETGIKLDIKDCNPYYSDSLDLRGTIIKSLPDGLTVGGDLDLEGTSIKSLPDGLTVGGDLYLEGTSIESLPDGLTVGGSLDLRRTSIKSLPDGLTVGGGLDLRGTSIKSLPDGLTVGGNLYLEGTSIKSLPDGLTVGGGLDLRGTSIKSLPDGLTVGGSLFLRGTSIESLPDGLTVGGNLYLGGTSIKSLPDGLTVGGSLDLEGTRINNIDNINKSIPDILEWRNKKYIKCDGVFNIVISHKGNVYQVKDIGKDKIYYLVGDGNGKWAHGSSLQKAKRDLIYKISNRDKSRYKNLNLDSILSYEEAIECYRVITGACVAGTRGFIENKLSVKKDSYTISEIIKLTDGEYGNNEFKEFFS